MIGPLLATAGRLLLAARPYLFLASNMVSLAITAGEIARSISILRFYRRTSWRPGARPAPGSSSYRHKP